MTLLNGKIGNSYIVIELSVEGNAAKRLQALGLITGTKVSILNAKKNGAVIFKVRGTRLAVGRKIAESIHVTED
jgi:ferrous iron transport protein A